jgi:antirestriction protein ArdC
VVPATAGMKMPSMAMPTPASGGMHKQRATTISLARQARIIALTSAALAVAVWLTAHELTHWSGAKHRLARDMGKRFGDHAYAAEELVTEIGAAFLCAELGITQETRADHAQYLAQWLALMKGDSRAIFAAAAKASEAATYLKRFSASVSCAA